MQVPLSAEEGALSSGVGEGPALSRAEALRTEGAAPNSSASDSEAGPSHPSSRNGLDRGAHAPAACVGHHSAVHCQLGTHTRRGATAAPRPAWARRR